MTERLKAIVESDWSMNAYRLATSLFIYVVSGYYIIKKIDSEKVLSLDFLFIKFENIPEPLYMIIVAIFLSIIVNFARDFFNVGIQYLKTKTEGKENGN